MSCLFWEIQYWKIPRSWNLGQRSIKVIESDTIQYTGYGFLLVFYNNFVPKTFLRYLTSKNVVTLKSGSKAIHGHRNRHVYDWLLMFHSNHRLSRTVSKIDGNFSQNCQFFPHPCIFRPRQRGSPRNWVPALGRKKLVMGLPGRIRSLTISSAVWIQCTNVSDGRQQRQKDKN